MIPLAFVDIFPAQENGYPGTNFGNQCWGGSYAYKGPGNDLALNQLQSECPQPVADIPVCQTGYGKKILLSLGGGTTLKTAKPLLISYGALSGHKHKSGSIAAFPVRLTDPTINQLKWMASILTLKFRQQVRKSSIF